MSPPRHPPRARDERYRDLPQATRDAAKSEERIATGSMVDLVVAPFLVLADAMFGTRLAPRASQPRDRSLAAGYVLLAAIVVAVLLLL